MSGYGDSRSKKKNALNAARAVNVAREGAMAFLEADGNADGKLCFGEVYCAKRAIATQQRYNPLASRLPQFKNAVVRMRRLGGTSDNAMPATDEELQELFKTIDADNSNAICMSEYFLWTLEVATQHGCGLEAIFKKYGHFT